MDAWWKGQTPDRPTPIDSAARWTPGPVVATAIALSVIVTVLVGARPVPSALRGLVYRSGRQFEPADSKAARRLSAEADALMRAFKSDQAESLLRQAIASDPSFASAHVLLAWALRNQGKPAAEYVPLATRAEQLASRSTEIERLFVHASYLEMTGSEADACAAFEALVRIQPDDYWATNNAALCSIRAGDGPRAAHFWGRRADLDPDGIDDNVMAAWANEFFIGSPSAATRYLTRAEQLLTRRTHQTALCSDAWLRLLPAYRRWLEGDAGAAATQVTLALKSAERLDPFRRDDLLYFAAMFRITLGQLNDAEQVFGQMTAGQHRFRGLVAYARGDQARARLLLGSSVSPPPSSESAIIIARVGLTNGGEAYLRRPNVAMGDWQKEAVTGELALRTGDTPRGLEHLNRAVLGRGLRYNRPITYFLAAESFAQALAQSGAIDDAIDVTEIAATARSHSYDPFAGGPGAGYFWLRVKLLQAELSRQRGHAADSRRVAAEVARLLSHADSDFPLLVRARRLLD